MKTKSILCIAAIGLMNATAAVAGDGNKKDQKVMLPDEVLMITKSGTQHSMPSAAKTTGLDSRMVAIAKRTHNGTQFVINDSSFYTYSGNRGGDADASVLKYDNGHVWNYVGNSYIDNTRTNQTFDLNNNLTLSVVEKFSTSLNTWGNYSKRINTYDGNNNPLVEESQVWITATQAWRGSSKSTYTYNSNNDVLTYIYQTWNNVANAYVNYTMYVYTYNGQGLMTEYLYQNWDANANAWKNGNQTLYTYDGNNRLTMALGNSWTNNAWKPGDRSTYSYNTQSQLVTMLVESNNNNIWTNQSKNDYGYDTNGNMTSDTYSQWNNNAWDLLIKNLYNYDVNNNKLSNIYQEYNAVSQTFDNSERFSYTYDSHNNKTSYLSEKWVNTNWASVLNYQKELYYYEEYNTTAVHQSVLNITDFKLYPVPAKDMLNVDMSWEKAQPFSVSIIDLTGRTLQSWDEAATKQYHKNIQLPNVPSGNYFIRFSGAEGSVTKQFTITR